MSETYNQIRRIGQNTPFTHKSSTDTDYWEIGNASEVDDATQVEHIPHSPEQIEQEPRNCARLAADSR